MDYSGVYSKIPGKEVEDAAIRNGEMKLNICPRPVVRTRRHGQCYCQKRPLKEGAMNQNRKGQ